MYVLAVVALVVALVGIAIAYSVWFAPSAQPKPVPAALVPLHRLFYRKYYVDELYDAAIVRPVQNTAEVLSDDVDSDIIDGLVNGTAGGIVTVGGGFGSWETGYVRVYALSILAGAAVLVGFVIWHT